MTHKLVATFTNGLGKKHDWTYHEIDPRVSAQEIKEACELLTTLDLFEQDGVPLFDTVVTAKIVTKIERDIFDRTLPAAESKSLPASFPAEAEKETEEEQRLPLPSPSKDGRKWFSGTEKKESSDHPYSLILPASTIGTKSLLTTTESPESEKQTSLPIQGKEPPPAKKRFFSPLFRRRKRQRE